MNSSTSKHVPENIVILIPTCNRFSSLASTLESLAACHSLEYLTEVIIVNNGDFGDSDKIQALGEALPFATQTLYQQKKGVAHAINKGLDIIEEKYKPNTLVLKVDDDVSFASGWLSGMLDAARRNGPRAIVGGKITPQFPQKIDDAFSHNEVISHNLLFAEYDYGDLECYVDMKPVGPNMGFFLGLLGGIRCRPELGLPDCLGEETQLNHELSENGGQFIYVPTAQVWHHIRTDQLTEEWILRRVFMYGVTATRVRSLHFPELSSKYMRERYRKNTRRYWKAKTKAKLFDLIGNHRKSFHYRYKSNQKLGAAQEWHRLLEIKNRNTNS